MKPSFFAIVRPVLVAAALLCAVPSASWAQGNDNPTGVAGIFNGNSDTGCSYDPYTGNAVRIIPDLTVTGAVGSYPMVWARIMNSRGSNAGNLGTGGGWRHSYQWSIASTGWTAQDPTPTSYTVNYPDGRVVTFSGSNPSVPYVGMLGVTDRFQAVTGAGDCFLLLADGGSVRFSQTVTYDGVSGTYSNLHVSPPDLMFDPAGVYTVLTYDNPTAGKLIQVTEKAGRWLKVAYNGDNTIKNVTSGYGTGAGTTTQTVTYTYSPYGAYTVLTKAAYSGTPATSAIYTYQNSNTSSNGAPLLSTCADVRYPGPMKNIAYTFLVNSSYGRLSKEFDASPTGALVLTLTVSGGSRTETRGDGKSRTFVYNATIPTSPVQTVPYLLASRTDFDPTHPATVFSYGTSGHISGITDPNGHKTSFTRIGTTGAIKTMTHPNVVGEGAATITYDYEEADGYHLKDVIDELGHQTTYHHDDADTMRTTSITYANNQTEWFTYNNFNQVLTHTRVSGGIENYTYDGRGLLQSYVPPGTTSDPNPGGHPTVYSYDGDDHLKSTTDPRGFTTSYVFNERGQLTSMTHPDADQSKVVTAYNNDGTVQSVKVDYSATGTATTNYYYDDFKRLKKVTTPLGFVTNIYYDNAGSGVDEYTHTDANVTRAVSAMGVVTRNVYDNNHFLLSSTSGYGSGFPATFVFIYDNIGNVTTRIEPNHAGDSSPPSWISVYDARDRLKTFTDPYGKQTSYTYDAASNKKSQQEPNGQIITYDSYTVMNRLLQMTVPQNGTTNAVTHYTWTAAGKVATMIDPRSKLYQYEYDSQDRLSALTYPADNGGATRTEVYSYDFAGNLATFKNRAGFVQTFGYDHRNRESSYDWNDSITPSRTQTFDDASNLLSSDNGNASIDRVYDADFRLTSETETINNYADGTPRKVTYTYDSDGRRATIKYPSGQIFKYDYSARSQLAKVYDQSAAGSPVQVSYTYDASGHRTFRGILGKTTFSDPNFTNYRYDGVGDRLVFNQHYWPNASNLFNYAYDVMGNLKYEMRDWQSQGDGFQYDLANQISGYQREGTVNTTTGTVSAPQNNDTLSYDKNGNRLSVADSATSATTIYDPANDLNQYTTVGGAGVGYGSNGNLTSYSGWTYTYNSMNQLTSAVKGTTTAYFWYDALGRICTRQINGGTGVRFNVYDGWNLIEEYNYNAGHPLDSRYLYGAGEMASMWRAGQTYYYYQDGRGNNSQMADSNGVLLESYKFDLDGTPTVYDPNGNEITTGSSISNRFFLGGEEYFSQLGIYNLRNRFYLPALGRFLQPDPIGFAGDASNMYRYGGNNPVNSSDPSGEAAVFHYSPSGGYYSYWVNPGWQSVHGFVPGSGGQCAAGAQILSGGYIGTGSVYHDVPRTRTWIQGATLGSSTTIGTVVATGWQDHGYPSLDPNQYKAQYGDDSTVNHTGILIGFQDGNALILNQSVNSELHITVLSPGGQQQWNEVNVAKSNGPLDPAPSGTNGGRGAGGGGGTFPGGLVIFGRDSSGAALYNDGTGWAPIGEAPADVRFSENSGTGNWISDQTTKNAEMYSGPQYGEGFHPVPIEKE